MIYIQNQRIHLIEMICIVFHIAIVLEKKKIYEIENFVIKYRC